MNFTQALARGLALKAANTNELTPYVGQELTPASTRFWQTWFGASSFTGASISVAQAMQLSTVWACVRLIAETIATLPFPLYRRNPRTGLKEPAYDHPLYVLLHDLPNAYATSVVFWETVIASLLLWGNAYVELLRLGNRLVSLEFLLPSQMLPLRKASDGSIIYEYRDSAGGMARRIPEANMMHIVAFSLDGITGISPVVWGVNVLGGARETDKSAAETFRDALRSPGLITMDMVLQKQQREQVREHVKKVSEEGGVYVLEKGSEFQKIGFDPVTAQLLETRRFNVEEMCRWYRVDPAMVGHGQKDSNWGTGLEQKMQWLITFTLRHWCVRIEQAVRKNLLTPEERLTYTAEFNLEGLLRGDSAARAQFYSTMTQNGAMTRDEVRGKENLPPKGGNANVLTVQSNMLPLDQLGQQQQQQAPQPFGALAKILGL